jgi:hypothetical protein
MFAVFNPVIGMLHNTKLNRWHPILFVEAPLPGPPDVGEPVRHKSKGHHTAGFETRELALARAEELAKQIAPDSIGPVSMSLEKDILWDGDGIPALVTFFLGGEVVVAA